MVNVRYLFGRTGAMRWELLPGSSNVYRFPVELVAKPTADLLRSVAPDVREVSLIAEAFGLEEPPMESGTRRTGRWRSGSPRRPAGRRTQRRRERRSRQCRNRSSSGRSECAERRAKPGCDRT